MSRPSLLAQSRGAGLGGLGDERETMALTEAFNRGEMTQEQFADSLGRLGSGERGAHAPIPYRGTVAGQPQGLGAVARPPAVEGIMDSHEKGFLSGSRALGLLGAIDSPEARSAADFISAPAPQIASRPVGNTGARPAKAERWMLAKDGQTTSKRFDKALNGMLSRLKVDGTADHKAVEDLPRKRKKKLVYLMNLPASFRESVLGAAPVSEWSVFDPSEMTKDERRLLNSLVVQNKREEKRAEREARNREKTKLVRASLQDQRAE